jgi:hypothetical protein
MSIIVPPVFTDMHEEEVDVESPGSELILQKLIQNSNFLGDLFPVGFIMGFNVNQLGAPSIDPNYFQLCDGSEITHPNSPLRSIGVNQRFTPTLNEVYPKFANAATGNPTGGSFDFNIDHNHGGVTGTSTGTSFIIYNDGKDDSKPWFNPHSHAIQTGPGILTKDYPAWLKLAPYMRIV